MTSDMLFEGVHFDLAYTPPELLGRKSLAVNLSDIAAMGGKPLWFLLSLGLPSTLPLEFVDRFVAGLLAIADEHHVTLIGGDTCSSRAGLVISITLIGEQGADRITYRNSAKPGDLICVTGTIGDSALGLAQLRAGITEGHPVARHLDPTPRCATGKALAESGIPSAMIDISDGLLADLDHILKLSGAGAKVETDRIPLSTDFKDTAGKFAADPVQLAMTGGEDYELLLTLPPQRYDDAHRLAKETGVPLTVIGKVTAGTGLSVRDRNGKSHDSATHGFIHF
jgi:thiamine-monophosphate kinase